MTLLRRLRAQGQAGEVVGANRLGVRGETVFFFFVVVGRCLLGFSKKNCKQKTLHGYSCGCPRPLPFHLRARLSALPGAVGRDHRATGSVGQTAGDRGLLGSLRCFFLLKHRSKKERVFVAWGVVDYYFRTFFLG